SLTFRAPNAPARFLFRRRDPARAREHDEGRGAQGARRALEARRQSSADAVQDAEATGDARLDRHRTAHRDSPLPVAGRDAPALRIWTELPGRRFQGYR